MLATGMSATLLFVHGTGVRSERFVKLLDVLACGVVEYGLELEVRGCFWGDAEGAKLHAGGDSIPTYADTGGAPPTDEEVWRAIWTLLYTDPWYELRLLRHAPTGGQLPPGQASPPQALIAQVVAFQPSEVLRSRLEKTSLWASFCNGCDALRVAPELAQAAATAQGDALEHRQAIARALIAYAVVAAEADGLPPVAGHARDVIAATVADELGGYGLGVAAFLKQQVAGLAARTATRKLTGDRGAITDATSPTAGDILRFLSRGEGLRKLLRARIDDCARVGPVHLLGHSLGGIMCVDVLARGAHGGVERLITVGSQAPFLYEIDALPALRYGDPLPDHFPPWTNVYDRRDILSYVGAGVFAGRVTDVEVDNGDAFPTAHSSYWTNPDLWTAIRMAVA